MPIRKPNCNQCSCGNHFWAHATRWAICLVSPVDVHFLNEFAWTLLVPKNGYAYVRSNYGGHRTLHQAIFPDAPMVDHKDGNGLDCRRSNIRPAERGQNRANVRTAPRGRSGYHGVHVNSSGRGLPWKAAIKAQKKFKHLGYFSSAEDAAKARDAAALEYFGEFAVLNFPDEQ